MMSSEEVRLDDCAHHEVRLYRSGSCQAATPPTPSLPRETEIVISTAAQHSEYWSLHCLCLVPVGRAQSLGHPSDDLLLVLTMPRLQVEVDTTVRSRPCFLCPSFSSVSDRTIAVAFC